MINVEVMLFDRKGIEKRKQILVLVWCGHGWRLVIMSWNLNRYTQNGKFSHSSVVEMIPIENLQRPAINEKEAEIGQYLKNVENFKCCKFFSWVRQMKTCPGISRGRHSLHGAGWETSTHGGDRCGQVIIRCSLQGCNRAFTHFT